MALEAFAMDLALDEHRSIRLMPFSRTELAGELPKVSRAVVAQGEVVITAHNKPELVLMTVERYLQLQEASRPNLGQLNQEFEDMFEAMQTLKAPEGAAAAFAMSGPELGQIALRAMQK